MSLADGDDAALGAEVRRLFSSEHRYEMLRAMSQNTRNSYKGSCGIDALEKRTPSTNDYFTLLVVLWLEYQRLAGYAEAANAEISRLERELSEYLPFDEDEDT